MATTITVGTGGDYADPASAWQGVISSNQLLIVEDYVFDIISDVTIDTASGLNTVDLGGHSITWTCSHNEANKEDWQNWYKITVASGSASGMTFSVGQGVPESITGGIFNFNYLYSVNSTVGISAGNQTKAFV